MAKKHIRILGPSSHITPDMINDGIQWLRNQNFDVSVADQVYKKNNQSAGTVEDKIDALHAAYSDPDVSFIMASCGGNGAIHLLDHIDYDLIKSNPKPFIGFSDTTILLNAIHHKTEIVTFHGATATQIQKPLPDEQLRHMLQTLNGDFKPIKWSDCKTVQEGTAKGRLIGGNLSVFQAMIGTPYLPDLSKPYILFLEDVGDELSRYDRMLAHIRHAGLFKNASAILFGDFHSSNHPARVPFGKTMDDIVRDNIKDLNIPIAMNCPFGHQGNLWTLPIGQNVELKVSKGQVYLS
jgi:muramoyltetrapeptide carboxypeptidase